MINSGQASLQYTFATVSSKLADAPVETATQPQCIVVSSAIV